MGFYEEQIFFVNSVRYFLFLRILRTTEIGVLVLRVLKSQPSSSSCFCLNNQFARLRSLRCTLPYCVILIVSVLSSSHILTLFRLSLICEYSIFLVGSCEFDFVVRIISLLQKY